MRRRSKKTTTKHSAFRRKLRPTRFAKPTVGSPVNIILTSTPATSRPNNASKTSRRPTTFSATRRSVRCMTSSASIRKTPVFRVPEPEQAGSTSTVSISAISTPAVRVVRVPAADAQAGAVRRFVFADVPPGRCHAHSHRGTGREDLEYAVDIGFWDAIRGTNVRLTVFRHEACGACRGVGNVGAGAMVCPECGGRRPSQPGHRCNAF